MTGASKRTRRLLGLAACLVWVLGFELLPNLHVGFHHLWSHHSHGDADADDHHGGSPDHGARSLDHKQVATLEPPPPLLVPPPVLVGEIDAPAPASKPPLLRPPRDQRARGPPMPV